MLEIRNIHSRYGAVKVLHGISLRVDSGELVALIGANGAGKTTTLSTVAGIGRPSEGQILFKGESIAGLPPEAIVRKGIAMVPENRDIFASLTVEQNLRLGAYILSDRAEYAHDLEEMIALFPVLGVRINQLAWTMSGGEQQHLALARALMSRPELRVFDEPSLGLSPKLVSHLFELIQRLHAEGRSILHFEQHVVQTLAIADRAYLIRMGQIEASGTPDTLRREIDVERAYLGGAGRGQVPT